MQCDARTRNRIINHLFGHLNEFQHVNQPTSTFTKLHALIAALRNRLRMSLPRRYANEESIIVLTILPKSIKVRLLKDSVPTFAPRYAFIQRNAGNRFARRGYFAGRKIRIARSKHAEITEHARESPHIPVIVAKDDQTSVVLKTCMDVSEKIFG